MITDICSDLIFTPEDHTYRISDKVLTSVTQYLKPLSNSVYGSVSSSVLKKAATRGTIVHTAIESYIKTGIKYIDDDFLGYFDAFVSFWNDYNPEPIASEIKMYHKTLLYAGTIDFICKLNDKMTIIDFKTTATVNNVLTRPQLEAYKRGLESQGVTISDKGILHLENSGKYTYIPHLDSPRDWRVFLSLMDIHNYIHEVIN